MSETSAILAANAEFYSAVEAGDVDRIAAVWDDADDISCVHLGWTVVHGRSRVLRSWAVIMANTAYLQFFPTEARAIVYGEVGIVTCEHSLLARTTDEETGLGDTARVVATNVFRRRDDGWRLWAHHASPVAAATDDGEQS